MSVRVVKSVLVSFNTNKFRDCYSRNEADKRRRKTIWMFLSDDFLDLEEFFLYIFMFIMNRTCDG